MLCSIPTVGKSGSNWLDRLRSSKGFPTADNNLDLDHFLFNNPNPSTSPVTVINSESTRSNEEMEISGEKQQWFGIMTNVLSDLFNMGGPSQTKNRRLFSGKRSGRKQTNPKCCVNAVRKDENVQQAATASLNSRNNSDEDEEMEKEEEEKGSSGGSERELKGYSKSEVTVIDTSFDVWKFDKLVFRRKSIWKVREKKGKSWNVGSKKRKGCYEKGDTGTKKKPKLSNGRDSTMASNHCQEAQDDRRKVYKEIPDGINQVPGKRFSRSPIKSKENAPFIGVTKAIPTCHESGRKLTKNRLKDSQRQCKA